jgi:hypothetical protein
MSLPLTLRDIAARDRVAHMSRADRAAWIRARIDEGHPRSSVYAALKPARITGQPRGRPRDESLRRCYACGQATQAESATQSAARHQHLEMELVTAVRGGDLATARALADRLWPEAEPERAPAPPQPLKLSRSQVKEADRVGGIELMVLWPAALGPEPLSEIAPGASREPTEAERTYVETVATAACEANDLVLAGLEVVHAQRPKHQYAVARDEWRVHLALHLVGRRWANPRRPTRPPPLRWHELSPR